MCAAHLLLGPDAELRCAVLVNITQAYQKLTVLYTYYVIGSDMLVCTLLRQNVLNRAAC